MTKEELVELVDQVYATYRAELPNKDGDLTTTLNAWYELLHDLDLQDAKRAFRKMAVTREFMPRPGEIRKVTIDTTTKVPPFDDPIIAWGKWITLSQEVNSGMPPSIEVSAALAGTIKAMGQSAYNLHTNSDRAVFSQAYEKVVAELEQDKYAVPDPPPKKITQQ
jgi:hypothetical protein